jgi:hypothetical protein
MTEAGSEIPQSADAQSKKPGKAATPQPATSVAPKVKGLDYSKGYPTVIKKTIEPSPPTPKEDVGILVDFQEYDDSLEKRLEIDKSILDKLLDDVREDNKAPRYWFNSLVSKHDYEKTFWFILNLKATLLNSANANLLKEWRISDKVKIPPQDSQEVKAIASLYEQKWEGKEKKIETNTKKIKEYIFEDETQAEERKEVILNIALGNLGGLYKELITRENRAAIMKTVQQAT